jgi:glycerate kinase
MNDSNTPESEVLSGSTVMKWREKSVTGIHYEGGPVYPHEVRLAHLSLGCATGEETVPTPPIWLLAPDAFKGTLDAAEVAQGLLEGVHSKRPDLEVLSMPMADGGEGTLEVLHSALGGTVSHVRVDSPRLGAPARTAPWLLLPSGTAVVELAACAGLTLLESADQDPLMTSTFPLGQLLDAVLAEDIASLVIGLGGSGTVDAGLGALQALGANLSVAGRRLERPCTGGDLLDIESIDLAPLQARVSKLEVRLAVDVMNGLSGPTGAARVYGPQKGADGPAVERLEAGICHVATLLGDSGLHPGDGAAGGVGFGFRLGLHAEIDSGAALVAGLIGLPEACERASVVVTGEGCYDEQTDFGKVPSEIARLARSGGARSALVAGRINRSPDALAEDLFAAHVDLVGLSGDPAVGDRQRLQLAGQRLVDLLVPK